MQQGFITLPVLIIAILGTLVVGGGGYAAYKINQIERINDNKLIELEQKIEEMSSITNVEQTDDNSEDIQDDLVIEGEFDTSQVEVPQRPINTPTTQTAQNPTVTTEKNYNYVLIDSRRSNVKNAQELQKTINSIYSILDSERTKFIRMRSEVSTNMRTQLGMSESEVNNDTVIKIIDEYIAWTNNQKQVFRVYDDSLLNIVSIYNKLILEAQSQQVSYAEAMTFISTTREGQEIVSYSNEIDKKYNSLINFRSEVYGMLLSVANTNLTPSQPLPPINLPKITTTHCFNQHNTIVCNSIGN